MSRAGSEAHGIERRFLEETLARVRHEVTKRLDRVSRLMPEVAEEARRCADTPVTQWPRPVSPEVRMELRSLKLEEAIIAELLKAIDDRPLAEALERRIGAIEDDELHRVEEETNGLYLRDAHYWDDEYALDVLNRLFTEWASWLRRQPLRGSR